MPAFHLKSPRWQGKRQIQLTTLEIGALQSGGRLVTCSDTQYMQGASLKKFFYHISLIIHMVFHYALN
jgi:hypothetical protein